jgi:MurNAc alpha-1-phosphate uridylyltransferase
MPAAFHGAAWRQKGLRMASDPDCAFILAAGLGTRLRPYTDHCPKPLVEVAGRSLLSRILDHLEQGGIKNVVINAHYLADQIADHVKTRTHPHVQISFEDEILNTGLGIKRGLKYLPQDRPFFALNGDALWDEGPGDPALKRMAQAWDDQIMDILLLLQPVATMHLTQGVGDYDISEDGRGLRSKNQSGAYMFTGIRLNHPRIFENSPDQPFSYLELMDRAQAQGRLHALVHEGAWHHISTPADLDNINEAFRKTRVSK